MSIATPAGVSRFGQFTLWRAQRRLLRGGQPVELEDRVFDLILLLLDNRERALERREIIDVLWGRRPVSDATLRQLLYKARRVLDDDGDRQAVIRTAHGRSLQWVAPVEDTSEFELGAPSAFVSSAALHPDAGRSSNVALFRHADTNSSSVPIEYPDAVDTAPLTSQPASAESPEVVPHSPRRHPLLFTLAWLLLIALVAVPGVLWLRRSAASATSTKSEAVAPTAPVTLAVLPFLNMDADPGMGYLSDGLTDELIDRLGRVGNLRVAARTSAFVFRDKPVDVREAARALGVANVVEGSVQRAGERWRVRVALVSADDGYVQWSAEYDPAIDNMIAVEDTIARKVVQQLQPKLDPRALAAMHTPAPADPAAHDFYLIGLEYLNRRTAADDTQAIAYFQRAIQADPNYAPAWSGVAMTYAILRDYNNGLPPDLHYADGLAAANKAIALGPKLSHPHAVLGQLYDEQWEWAKAAREYKLALQMDPSNATANQWYGLHLWYTGDNAGTLTQMRKARDLDPLSPIINTDLGRALLFIGDEKGAIAQFRATIAMAPNFALARLLLAQAEMNIGKYGVALADMRAAVALTPEPHPSTYLAVLGVAEYLAGDKNGAHQQLAILEARSKQQYVSGVSLALLYWQFGDKDKGMANLTRAVANYDPLMRPAVSAPGAEWRSDPRFEQLVAKMGLPPRATLVAH